MNRAYFTSWHIVLILAAVVLFLNDRNTPPAPQTEAPPPNFQVYFSPRGGTTSAIVRMLDEAKKSILVQAYSFTSEPIAVILIKAHGRGIVVQVILDRSQKTQKYSTAALLIRAGIPVFIDASHAIAHNKVAIIDNEVVITGSFNFTKAAEDRNAENLLIIRNKHLATLYADNWRLHRSHSSSCRPDGH